MHWTLVEYSVHQILLYFTNSLSNESNEKQNSLTPWRKVVTEIFWGSLVATVCIHGPVSANQTHHLWSLKWNLATHRGPQTVHAGVWQGVAIMVKLCKWCWQQCPHWTGPVNNFGHGSWLLPRSPCSVLQPWLCLEVLWVSLISFQLPGRVDFCCLQSQILRDTQRGSLRRWHWNWNMKGKKKQRSREPEDARKDEG